MTDARVGARTAASPFAANGPDRLAQLQDNVQRAATLLKTMANPARLVVLCLLAERERSVGELERAVGMSQSGISQHLAVLRRAGVVSRRRVRQTVLYSLAGDEAVAIMTTLHALFCEPSSPARANGRRKPRPAQRATIDPQSS